jgi:excisionase family DNA binding protein
MSKNGKKIRIFSALEVANICGVVNQTAINWIKNGHLKAFTTPGGQYRIYAEELRKFLSSREMRIPEELEKLTQGSLSQKILVVDDNVELNDLLKEFLTQRIPEYEVLQATDGFAAGRQITSERPAVIILDIALPGIDGHKLCKTIKEDPDLDNPFVIAISGLDDPKEREQIIDEGADLFFPKPIDFDTFIESLKELLPRAV